CSLYQWVCLVVSLVWS
ncbi:acrB/AcrD/AcrF family protein, partial [Vibrio parahaemolyticus V-223/04]